MGPRPHHDHSEEDGSAGPMRDNRADPSLNPSIASQGRGQEWAAADSDDVARTQPHLPTRQYTRIVHTWIESAGPMAPLRHALDAADKGGADLQEDKARAERKRCCQATTCG